MDFAHIYGLHKLLNGRRYPLPLDELLIKLECSKSTFYRIREVMVDYLDAPIENQRGKGYFYNLSDNETFELPGVWFNTDEIIALALLTQLSESLQPALVSELLKPLEKQLQQLLTDQKIDPQLWQQRIRASSQWQRPCHPDQFKLITSALVHRQQLKINHWHWQNNQQIARRISPQRLLLYRDNWYLDAWCHLRQALRTFSVDAITDVVIVDKAAKDISAKQLDAYVTDGYGIFAGAKIADAQLKFSASISRRVIKENWHPQQITEWTSENELLLTIPYSDQRELLRDILHYGSDVEVLAPAALRQCVISELKKTAKKYR